MARAARLIYLMSGILIMASGVYLQLNPKTSLPHSARLSVGLICIVYFGFQLYRFLLAESTIPARPEPVSNHDNFGLDFIEQ